MRLDVRLPSNRQQLLQVPDIDTFAYGIFKDKSYTGVGRGARPAAPPNSMAERFVKLHCGRCMRELPENSKGRKALNKGAWYWVCPSGCRGMDSTEEWRCPTAAEGKRGCKCCCPPKQAQLGKRRAGGKGFTSSRQRKSQRKAEARTRS